MIVESITVRNWRGFRDEHRFDLGDRLNLLVGLNEAGKSTVFEVLQRTFFDRYNGSSQELKAMRPLSSTLGPEAEIEVRTDGDRFRIVKRFLESPDSRLYTWRSGEWEMDHEGDEADKRIRALFEGDLPGRGVTKGEHRGLAQALWYLQREDDLPSSSWNAAVERGLQGTAEVVASTPEEAALLERIEAAYDEHWTPTGRLSKKSPVSELEEEIPELEDELAELRDRLDEAGAHREALERLAIERDEKSAEIDSLEGTAGELEAEIEAAAGLSEEKNALERELASVESEHETLAGRLEQIRELDEEIEKAEEQVAEARSELGEARVDEERAKGRKAELRRRLKEEVGPKAESTAELSRQIEALRQLRELEAESERLDAKVERLEALRKERDNLEEEIREMRAPTQDELEAFRETVRKAELTAAKVEAAAIRIRFDLDGLEVTAEPAAQREGDEYLITTATRFDIADLGAVEVRGGGEDLETLHVRIQELKDERDAVLARFDAEDPQSLYDAAEARTTLQRELEQVESTIEALLEDGDPAEARESVYERRRERERAVEGLDGSDRDLSGEALERRLDSLESERDEASSEQEQLAEDLEEAEQEHVEALTAKGNAESRMSEQTATEKGLRKQKSRLLEQHGSVDGLESQVEDRAVTVEEKNAALKELEAAYAEQVERPREELEDIRKQKEGLREALKENELKETRLSSALETLAGENLYSRAADLEATLEAKKRRLPVLKRRADGAKVLRELVHELLAERSDVLAGPVAQRVTGWLGQLTADAYDHVELTRELKPESVRSSRYGESLPVTELSHGTREQLVVLLRLSIAMLLSEEERHLVILDDRLVNSDVVRARRFRPILEEACDSCQILLATCNDSPYSGLDARLVRVPEDGRPTQEGAQAEETEMAAAGAE